jgi:hypothetical protein
MSTAELVEWCEAMDAAGKRDAMGYPFTSWLVAVCNDAGEPIRDEHQRKIFETQAAFKARLQQRAVPTGQTLSLF